MEDLKPLETRLLADIEALRASHPQTQDLYREVCALLFFRYGITPTANRLYQLVRRGSMSAPAEALNRFWGQLRECSRVTIEGPDIPEALRTGAGELVSALWKQAREAAAATYSDSRTEAQEQVDAARRAESAAAARADALATELAACQAALQAARDEATVVAQQASAAQALSGRLQQRIDDGRRELNEQHAWFKSVEREHTAAAQHAARELERERALAARLQQSWDDERAAAAATAERHRMELRETMASMAALAARLADAPAAEPPPAPARSGKRRSG